MSDKLAEAVQFHQSGKLEQAEAIYRSLLFHHPQHADALHFLGVLAAQTGRPAEGARLVQSSIDSNPRNPDVHANLGRIYLDTGDQENALKAYRAAANLKHSDSTAWFTLGLALRTCGRMDEAIKIFEKAVRLQPTFAEAYSEMGNLLRAMGKIDDAIESHRKAVKFAPLSPDAHSGLGNALSDRGMLEEAITHLMDAVRLDRNRSIFHSNLASVLVKLGRYDDSLTAYDYAIQLDRNNVDALTGKGIVLSKTQEFVEAMKFFQRSLALFPNHVFTLLSVAGMQYERHEVNAAAVLFRRVIELDALSLDGWIGLGQTQRADGRFEEAAISFRKAVEIDNNCAVALKNLAAIGIGSDPELARLEALLQNPETIDQDRVAAGFALGKLYDDLERFDEAFQRFNDANRQFKKMRTSDGDFFDKAALRLTVDWQIANFTAAYFATTRHWGNLSDSPVFVVGMPRSGTTLVEQIAASHPLVFGAGELSDIGDIAKKCILSSGPTRGLWTEEIIRPQAERHLQRLRLLAPDSARVVDKMPANIMNLAIIADLFPNARIIVCQRDARDTCLSCYFQWFGRNSQIFSYDLVDCGTQYRQQERLISHWRQSLPLRMLNVQYEEMVNDLEGQSRRLIDFLGLEWDPRCLDFHKTKRTVSTASVWQVRQPIYTSSVGRWRHYEKHLGPLMAALNGPEL